MRLVRWCVDRAKELLAAETDQSLLRARRSAERIVATLRIALVVAFVGVTSLQFGSGVVLVVQLSLSVTALLYAGLLYWWASKSTNPWMPWVSCALDVSVTSAGMVLFIVEGSPLNVVNNRVLFELYFVAIASSALRYDWRLCAFTVVLACVEFLGLSGYVALHWDLSKEVGPPETFAAIRHALRLVCWPRPEPAPLPSPVGRAIC